MAVTMTLYVVDPPVTMDHVMSVLKNVPYSGFFIDQNVRDLYDLGEPINAKDLEQAIEQDRRAKATILAAETRVRNDLEIIQRMRATNDYNHPNVASLINDPNQHFYRFAPCIIVGDSTVLPEETPFWNITDAAVVRFCE